MALALETRADLKLFCKVVSANNTLVCCLTATIETMEQRVRIRESGIAQKDYGAPVAELNGILDRAWLEDFTVNTEHRYVHARHMSRAHQSRNCCLDLRGQDFRGLEPCDRLLLREKKNRPDYDN